MIDRKILEKFSSEAKIRVIIMEKKLSDIEKEIRNINYILDCIDRGEEIIK